MQRLLIAILSFGISGALFAQPAPCGVDAMESTCIEACVVCDIDGFTGTNNLSIQGQTFPGFCTTIFHNMSYIAFIAGTENLVIDVTVTNCTINRGIEVGIFESLDCENFIPITACNTDVAPNGTARFSNLTPLVIGQHYYLIMDGSAGDICDWTFNVVEGSTVVGDLTTSGVITGTEELCPKVATTYATTAEVGATLFYWTVNGVAQNSLDPELEIEFPADGTYELCVTAANVCDEAPPTCQIINVVSPAPLFLTETLCAGECLEVAGQTVCASGLYEYIVPLPDGCDSMIFLDLIVLPELTAFIDINLCIGASFVIGSTPYASTGIFEEIVQTAEGCDSTVTLDLNMIECEIIGISNFTPPICHGAADGTLLFSLQNGTPIFNYDWSNIVKPGINGSGSTSLFTDILIENIPAGIYEINISDNFGDDIVFIQEVTEPPVLTLGLEATDFNGVNLSCFQANDGSITVGGNGGVAPYSFLWNDGQTDSTIVDLTAGQYEVMITDDSGCTVINNILLTEPDPLEFSVSFIDPNCEGEETGIIQLETISGGIPPFVFALDNSEFDEIDNYQNLSEGFYNFSILDANECFRDTSANLVAPDIPELYLEEELEIDLGCGVLIPVATNDTELIDISWLDLYQSLDCNSCLEPYATAVNDTEYILTVTSVDNCTATDSIFLRVNKLRDVYIPNAFSPNDDGVNDRFFINTNKSVSLIKDFKIFNRWGAVMYARTDLPPNDSQSGWDGIFNGEIMNSGVYVWVAEVEFLDGEILVLSGDVTLVL